MYCSLLSSLPFHRFAIPFPPFASFCASLCFRSRSPFFSKPVCTECNSLALDDSSFSPSQISPLWTCLFSLPHVSGFACSLFRTYSFDGPPFVSTLCFLIFPLLPLFVSFAFSLLPRLSSRISPLSSILLLLFYMFLLSPLLLFLLQFYLHWVNSIPDVFSFRTSILLGSLPMNTALPGVSLFRSVA